MSRIIAVYGSLRKGLGNHRVLGDSKLLSTERVKIPWRMVSLSAYPGLVPSDKIEDIVVELYEVTESTYRGVECLEGYPSFYQKALIPTSLGEVEVYVLERGYDDYPPVKSGDWVKYLTKTKDYEASGAY